VAANLREIIRSPRDHFHRMGTVPLQQGWLAIVGFLFAPVKQVFVLGAGLRYENSCFVECLPFGR
jgi:hypothetical protein